MMRGRRVWSVAVRRPDDAIHVERHEVSDFTRRHPLFAKPLLRGMAGLVDALSIGMRALGIAAREAAGEDEEEGSSGVGVSLALALVLFVGIFIVLPNAGLALLTGVLGSGLLYHVVEGVVRILIFLAYLGAISRLPDIQRVFAYHGAEHATITAWEHGEALEPERIQGYPTLHVRCGTNFLLLVMLTAILLYSVVGVLIPAPDSGLWAIVAYHVGLRIALLPVVAGVAYEGLRLGAGRSGPLVGALMAPGLWLQHITTKPPTLDQIEVAIRAFEAVVPRDDLDDRAAGELSSPVRLGALADGEGPYGLERAGADGASA